MTLNKTRVHFYRRPTNATSFLPSQRLININSGVKSLIGKLVAGTDPPVLLLIQANPSIHPTTQSLALISDLKNSNLRTNTNNFHGSPAIQFKCITRWANTLHPLPPTPPHFRVLKKFRGPRQAHLFTISTRQQRLLRFISPTTYLAD